MSSHRLLTFTQEGVLEVARVTCWLVPHSLLPACRPVHNCVQVGDELLSADVVRALRRARARALAELEQQGQEQGPDGGGYAQGKGKDQQQPHSGSGVSGDGDDDGGASGEFGGRGHGGFPTVIGQQGQQDGGGLLGGGGAGPRRRVLPEQLDPANWGLDRIDQAALPLDSRFHYDADGGVRPGITAERQSGWGNGRGTDLYALSGPIARVCA